MKLRRLVRLVRHLPELYEQFLAHRRWVNEVVQSPFMEPLTHDQWIRGAHLLARGQGLLNVVDGDPR